MADVVMTEVAAMRHIGPARAGLSRTASAAPVRRPGPSPTAALRAGADGSIAAPPGADAWAIRPACDAGGRRGARARVP